MPLRPVLSLRGPATSAPTVSPANTIETTDAASALLRLKAAPTHALRNERSDASTLSAMIRSAITKTSAHVQRWNPMASMTTSACCCAVSSDASVASGSRRLLASEVCIGFSASTPMDAIEGIASRLGRSCACHVVPSVRARVPGARPTLATLSRPRCFFWRLVSGSAFLALAARRKLRRHSRTGFCRTGARQLETNSTSAGVRALVQAAGRKVWRFELFGGCEQRTTLGNVSRDCRSGRWLQASVGFARCCAFDELAGRSLRSCCWAVRPR
mmetsp:Transcript_17931/g.55152  ORF Transcript_17931/g.55152 Transcript_17931/m.55152 type:complete len:272 (+) Transcript_17931:1152-1967(+)